MNILKINSNNPNFGMISKVRIPMLDGTTKLLQVTDKTRVNGFTKFTDIVGNIMYKGKVVGKTKEYHNKNGFNNERLANICEELSQGSKEPDKVTYQIIDSITRPNVNYNA